MLPREWLDWGPLALSRQRQLRGLSEHELRQLSAALCSPDLFSLALDDSNANNPNFSTIPTPKYPQRTTGQ
jgi:hypothetical protein